MANEKMAPSDRTAPPPDETPANTALELNRRVLKATQEVFAALEGLAPQTQHRVLGTVSHMLGLNQQQQPPRGQQQQRTNQPNQQPRNGNTQR
jgi:hypothetical protein